MISFLATPRPRHRGPLSRSHHNQVEAAARGISAAVTVRSVGNASGSLYPEAFPQVPRLSGNGVSAESRAIAQATIGVVVDLMHTPRLRQRPGMLDEPSVLVHAMVCPLNCIPMQCLQLLLTSCREHNSGSR